MAEYISRLPSEQWQNTWPRKLSVLGCTGSIGTSVLDVARASEGSLIPVALAGGKNMVVLAKQATEFRPRWLGVQDEEAKNIVQALLPAGYAPTILTGQSGYETLASLDEADLTVSAQSGAAGLRGTVAAVKAGKVVALANKESLVLAGNMVRTLCKKTGAVILPVDSEHNALFQCLAGSSIKEVTRLILTASGGPFYGKNKRELANVTVESSLSHPNWLMGAKISIDSATLMNKGLEIIEAHHLYGISLEQIEVLVHRQSIVHSLVEYADGSQLAQLGLPDMRVAIAYCLNWPLRKPSGVGALNLADIGALTFSPPDAEIFPCLRLAIEAQKTGGSAPIVLNAANEVAVAAFLQKKISFLSISAMVQDALTACQTSPSSFLTKTSIEQELESITEILSLDAATRDHAERRIASGAFLNTPAA